MRLRTAIFLATALLTVESSAKASDGLWLTDVKKALQKAAREGKKKDVLIDFTGSDWCIWCTRLDKEVFSQEVFKKEAPKYFVLVKLDFPRRKKLPPEVRKKNQQWLQKLGVQGFPTVFLLDALGKPYAKTGYQPGGAELYIEHLMKLRELRLARDKALREADKAEGVERAKLLHKAIGNMGPGLVVNFYGDLARQIMHLDKDGGAGLRSKYGAMFALNEVEQLKVQRKFQEAVKKADEALSQLKPAGQPAQDLNFAKAEALYLSGDKKASKETLLAALKAAPEGSKVEVIKLILKRLFGMKLEEKKE